MVGKLLGGGLVLLGTALWCRGEIQARRRETDRAAELAAALGEMVAEIRSLRRPMPRLLERQARRVLCGGCFARVLWGLERGQPLQDAWEDGFRELTPPEAAGILRDTELTGDEERIVSALTAAVHRLEELAEKLPTRVRVIEMDLSLADRRRRESRQRERLLWAAALSGAGLFIILLI